MSEHKEQSKIQSAASNCRYGKCDGSGMIIDKENTIVKFCKCREDSIHERRLKFANIPKEFKELTLNSFDLDLYENSESKFRAVMAKKAAVNFVKNYDLMKQLGKGLFFYSYVKGSGKTRLAASLGNALVNYKKVRVKFITTLDLLEEIKNTYSKDSEITQNELLSAIKNVEVLILDDIGIEEDKQWVKEIFYSILNGRMIGKKITMFTSNLAIEDLKHDERIKNRIEKMATPVYLPDESVRSKLAKKENEEIQELLFS